MKLIAIFTFIWCFTIPATAQKQEKVLAHIAETHYTTENPNQIIVISHSGCGHCLIALSKLQPLAPHLKVIVIEYGDKSKRQPLIDKYKDYTFIDGDALTDLGKQDFFPKLYLFKDHELIWQKEGWFARNLKRIKAKLNL